MSKNPAWLPPTTDFPLDVSLIIGSFKYEPIHQLLFRTDLPRSQPPPTNPEEAHYHVQPEIQHTFRPKEKIPPKFISGIFALATLSPWVVLIGLVCSTTFMIEILAPDAIFLAVGGHPSQNSKTVFKRDPPLCWTFSRVRGILGLLLDQPEAPASADLWYQSIAYHGCNWQTSIECSQSMEKSVVTYNGYAFALYIFLLTRYMPLS